MLRERQEVQGKIGSKFVCYKDGEVVFEFELSQTKTLIGRGENCDVTLDHPSLSHYHALFIIEDESIKVLDLDSSNGIYVNGERVKEKYIGTGDNLAIGELQFLSEETITNVEVVDQDAGIVQKVDEAKITEAPRELPPLPGLTIIDGEYCDITFDEDIYEPVREEKYLNDLICAETFIDTDEREEELPVYTQVDEKSIEVTTLSMGNIISVNHFPLKNGKTYHLSNYINNKTTVICGTLDEKEKKVPFLNVVGEKVTVLPPQEHEVVDFEKGTMEGPAVVEEGQVISLERGSVQIIVRIVKAPPKIKAAPFFGRDREFQKQTAKVFGIAMAFMLLLLLVDTTVEVQKDKVPVIFKKARRMAKAKQSAKNSNVNKDNGTRKENKPKKELAKKKKGTPKKKVAKKPTPQKKKSAPKKTASKKKAPVKKPVKAYKFNFNTKLAGMTGGNVKSANVAESTTSLSNNVQNFDSSSNLASASSENIGKLGGDSSGRARAAGGTKGLTNKNGTDSTYIEPQTVVLGSMDPELLRKILREYLPQFRHCYQEELNRNESVKGVVDLDFQINKFGKVSRANVISKKSKFSKAGRNCMAGVLKIIDFPKPKGGGVVDVRQPLNFTSEQSKI